MATMSSSGVAPQTVRPALNEGALEVRARKLGWSLILAASMAFAVALVVRAPRGAAVASGPTAATAVQPYAAAVAHSSARAGFCARELDALLVVHPVQTARALQVQGALAGAPAVPSQSARTWIDAELAPAASAVPTLRRLARSDARAGDASARAEQIAVTSRRSAERLCFAAQVARNLIGIRAP